MQAHLMSRSKEEKIPIDAVIEDEVSKRVARLAVEGDPEVGLLPTTPWQLPQKFEEPMPLVAAAAPCTLISEEHIQSFMAAPHTMVDLTFADQANGDDPDDVFAFKVVGYYKKAEEGLVFLVQYSGCVGKEEINGVEMESLLKDCSRIV